MAQGKRISTELGDDVLQTLKALGAAARQARTQAGEGQAAAAARLGVHVQTVGRIEAGEPGVAVGHVVGLLALYGLSARLAPSPVSPSPSPPTDIDTATP
jgi:HTH-type transcriptional regulator/antitoxin HipB